MTYESSKGTNDSREPESALAIPLSELVDWQNDQTDEMTKLKRTMKDRLGDDIIGELAPEDAFQLGKIAMGETLLGDFAALLEGQSNIVAGNLDTPEQLQHKG